MYPHSYNAVLVLYKISMFLLPIEFIAFGTNLKITGYIKLMQTDCNASAPSQILLVY